MISSVHNPKIQLIRRLQAQAKARREEQAFVVEGVRLLEEALAMDWLPQWIIHTDDLSPRGSQLVERCRELGVPLEAVSPHVMEAASDTRTPQGILGVMPLRMLPFPLQPDFALIPDAVRDPGNLGTILRAAAAAGVQVVFLPPGGVDAFAPKVVRAGMGAHFRLPLRTMEWEEIYSTLKPRLTFYLADAAAGAVYTQANLRLPLALILGGEAEGAGEQAQRFVDERLHIPMPGKMESLNAAAAAAILLFEVVRQRSGV